MASETLKVVLDPNGIDQIAAIIAKALPHCVCAICEQHREKQRHRGGDAGTEQE